MTSEQDLGLIHAEIDGELDAHERGKLSRRLLADPQVRAARDELRRLCAALEELPMVEPPAQLRVDIARALPPPAIPARQTRGMHMRWRIAAAVAGAVTLGGFLFATLDGQKTGSAELAGTIAAPRTPVTLDTARVHDGPVTGQVSLYRDAAGLGLRLDVVTSVLVDAVITGAGHTLTVTGVGQKGAPTVVSLAGFGTDAPQTLDVSFLASGSAMGHARLRMPSGH
jgi:anti-sigma factor RsiW